MKRELFSYVLPILVPAAGVAWIAGSKLVFLAALAAGIVANLVGYSQGLDRGVAIADAAWSGEKKP